MMWLAILSVSTSIVAIIIDESVMKINQHKLGGRDNYWFWVLYSMLFAAMAVTCIEFISAKAAGSGIP